jgi:UDPglucose 6-dehydrogenase
MLDSKKIAVIGAGYVGMSISVLLAQKFTVSVIDIDDSRVKSINNNQSTVQDAGISSFLLDDKLSIKATTCFKTGLEGAGIVIICTPTDYDETKLFFDASSVEASIAISIKENPNALIVIKSTIPIGFTKSMLEKFPSQKIIFSPEFLREGRALEDNLHPSRLIIGGDMSNTSNDFEKIIKSVIRKKDTPVLHMTSCEAESVKLFANSYLAMRVGFFNELDSFALNQNLNTESIIKALCLDPRIGNYYNNPSFGYGGYCLPKDVKQLEANFNQYSVPNSILASITASNEQRKDYVVEHILMSKPKVVGLCRIAMKHGSDNYRFSSILDVAERLYKKEVKVLIYEPSLDENPFKNYTIIESLHEFKSKSEIIIANRITDDLKDVLNKVFTRDIFNEN